MEFRTMQNKKVELSEYVKEYMRTHQGEQILIGCDSQNMKGKTVYAIVVAFYNTGHGGHVIFHKWKTNRERVGSIRLLNEVWKSVEVAEEIRKCGYDARYIDIDINPDPKYKSNEVFRQAVGLCEGMGYEVRYKHTAPLVTSMADYIVRGCGI